MPSFSAVPQSDDRMRRHPLLPHLDLTRMRIDAASMPLCDCRSSTIQDCIFASCFFLEHLLQDLRLMLHQNTWLSPWHQGNSVSRWHFTGSRAALLKLCLGIAWCIHFNASKHCVIDVISCRPTADMFAAAISACRAPGTALALGSAMRQSGISMNQDTANILARARLVLADDQEGTGARAEWCLKSINALNVHRLQDYLAKTAFEL